MLSEQQLKILSSLEKPGDFSAFTLDEIKKNFIDKRDIDLLCQHGFLDKIENEIKRKTISSIMNRSTLPRLQETIIIVELVERINYFFPRRLNAYFKSIIHPDFVYKKILEIHGLTYGDNIGERIERSHIGHEREDGSWITNELWVYCLVRHCIYTINYISDKHDKYIYRYVSFITNIEIVFACIRYFISTNIIGSFKTFSFNVPTIHERDNFIKYLYGYMINFKTDFGYDRYMNISFNIHKTIQNYVHYIKTSYTKESDDVYVYKFNNNVLSRHDIHNYDLLSLTHSIKHNIHNLNFYESFSRHMKKYYKIDTYTFKGVDVNSRNQFITSLFKESRLLSSFIEDGCISKDIIDGGLNPIKILSTKARRSLKRVLIGKPYEDIGNEEIHELMYIADYYDIPRLSVLYESLLISNNLNPEREYGLEFYHLLKNGFP